MQIKNLLSVVFVIFIYIKASSQFHSNKFSSSNFPSCQFDGIHKDNANNLYSIVGSNIIKTTPDNQNIIWSKDLNTSNQIAFSIVGFDNLNNHLSLSYMNGSVFTYEIVRKVNPNGNVLWSKSINANTNIHILSSLYARDKSIYLGSGDCAFQNIILKLDSLGNIVWAKTYFTNNNPLMGFISSIIEDSNGDLIITATNINTNNGRQSITFFKINPNGMIIWSKFHEILSSHNGTVGKSITKINSQKEIIYCYNHNDTNNIIAPVILKADSIGNLLWSHQYTFNNPIGTYIRDLDLDNLQNIIGVTNSIFRVNSGTGSPMQCIRNNTISLYSIHSIGTNSILIGGCTTSSVTLFKIDNSFNGMCEFNNTSFTYTPFATAQPSNNLYALDINITSSPITESLMPIQVSQANLCTNITSDHSIDQIDNSKLFPNPSNGQFFIEFDKEIIPESIQIKDITGRDVSFEKNLTGKKYIITKTTNQSGLFFITFQIEPGITIRKKILFN